jgi:hypothetical protein
VPGDGTSPGVDAGRGEAASQQGLHVPPDLTCCCHDRQPGQAVQERTPVRIHIAVLLVPQ